MVTYFNRKDLVEFGNYMVSRKRRERFEAIKSEIPLENRLEVVHKEDVDNFIDDKKRKDCESY